MQDIKNLEFSELKNFLEKQAQEGYHAGQIFSWLYKRSVLDFGLMSDLALPLRSMLKKEFSSESIILLKMLRSEDGTEKFLFQLGDKNTIEAVLIPQGSRVTGCISSQVGCKFACRFCASGGSGLKRDLTAAEMLEQVVLLNRERRLTHIVFMGSGEPLDNYAQVLKAIRIINSPQGLHIAARRITISTCGVVPGIEKLSKEGLQVELSVSLHAASDAVRNRLVPVNKKYPLDRLISACKDYIAKTGRQITFEYVLIKGLNADSASAKGLVSVVKSLRLAKVNLIAAHPVKGIGFEPPERQEILSFKNHLAKNGINVTLRKSRGADIQAACGQLRANHGP